jgi:hypothetical protein
VADVRPRLCPAVASLHGIAELATGFAIQDDLRSPCGRFEAQAAARMLAKPEDRPDIAERVVPSRHGAAVLEHGGNWLCGLLARIPGVAW